MINKITSENQIPNENLAANQLSQNQLHVTRVAGVMFLYLLSAGLAWVALALAGIITAILLVAYALPAGIPVTLSRTDSRGQLAPAKIAQRDEWRRDQFSPFQLLPTQEAHQLALKEELRREPNNLALQNEFRERDLLLRHDYFRRRAALQFFGKLLFLVAVIGIIAAKTATTLSRALPIPNAAGNRIAANGMLALGFFAVAALGILLGFSFVSDNISREMLVVAGNVAAQNNVAARNASSENSPNVAEHAPIQVATPLTFDRELFLQQKNKNWIGFRGDGSGVAHSSSEENADNLKFPIKWNAESGEGIAWQLDLPLAGNSSPILWNDFIFLTAADEARRVVICVSTSGEKLWETEIPTTVAPFEIEEDTGYAAPTPITDGVRVYAMFATGDMVACDFSGKIIWQKSLGFPESHYGFSASPALRFDRVIIQYDVDDGKQSKLICLDGASGKTLWETPREIPNSWSSPIVAEIAGREQIITAGDPFVIAYAPEDGKELWRCKALSGDVGPSPVVLGKYVVVTNQMPRTTMIDATGDGDVTATHIIWRGSNSLPDTSSPLALGTQLFTLSTSGYLTCYQTDQASDGKPPFWELEIGNGEGSFYSSPTCANPLIYCFDKTEDAPHCYVIDLSRAETTPAGKLTSTSESSMVIAANPMTEPCVASPILHSGRIYMRSNKRLWCIANAAE